ncbi:MAG TPA: hypothetical protein VE825_03305, partial [Terriglobales bacterium]|nr:hypothetical protein [Terriglobales bacterium]
MTTPAPAVTVHVSRWRQFCWSLRREIWENRSIYLVPLGVGVLIVLATAINVMHMAPQSHMTELDPMARDRNLEAPFIFASLLLMFSTMVVSVFYSVDALYGERRDRSVLFWKSMPVSDTVTVLSKLVIPLLVLDEPTLGLDILFRKQFYDSLLGDYFDGSRTVVVATHQVEEVEH